MAGGHYTATATATDAAGLNGTSIPVEFDVIGQGGTLSVSTAAPPLSVDLSFAGSADWIVWGTADGSDIVPDNPGMVLARKQAVQPQVSTFKAIGNHPITASFSANVLSFSDTTQNFSSSGSQLQIHGKKNGFELRVPADTTARTLSLYVAEFFARAKLTVFLSDGSAPVVNDVSFDDPTGTDGFGVAPTNVYNIHYAAASANQFLTVRFTMDHDYGSGELDLIAAALNGSPASPATNPPQISTLTPAVGQPNSIVTIAGNNFGVAQQGAQVFFDQVPAKVISWSDASIRVTAPASLSLGSTVQIGVSNSAGISNTVPFTVPTYSVSPVVLGLIIGQPRTLMAKDSQGQPVTGLQWSTDDNTVVSLSADDPPLITGLKVGTTTVFAGAMPVPVTVYASLPTFPGSSPMLQLAISDSPRDVNLTSSQILDWVHWGRISAMLPDRKGGVVPRISNYVPLNTQASVGSGVIAFSWADGNHPAAVSQATQDVETFDPNGGFKITVPADTTVKTLNLYTEVLSGQAQLQATLSDGSAAPILDQSVTDTNLGSKLYSIDFRAASAGQTLTVTLSSLSGGVGLQAAILTPHLPRLAISSPVLGQSFGASDTIPLSANVNQFDAPIVDVLLHASGTSFDAPVPPYNAGFLPPSPGHYSASAMATDFNGLVNSSNAVEFDVIGQGGALSIEEVPPPAFIDLDTEGTGDWVLWGPNGPNLNPTNILARKSGVLPLISHFGPLGNHPDSGAQSVHNLCFSGEGQSYCSGALVEVHGLQNGYELTLPADTSTRVLKLYVAVTNGDGLLTAFLSDGSAPVAVEVGGTGPPVTGETTSYTVTYSAASAGQTLTVRFVLNTDSGGGHADLIGATLSGAPLEASQSQPEISFITPSNVSPNTQVTVVGSNFGQTQGHSKVVFGNRAADVASWTDTTISATVPSSRQDGSSTPIQVLTSVGDSNIVFFNTPAYTVIPSSLTIPVGASASVAPQDSKGNVVFGLSWAVADPTIVTLSPADPPSIVGLAPGTTTVYAGDVPFSVTVFSGARPIISLTIGPANARLPVGVPQQLFATGRYADGTTQSLTSSATWISQNPSIASVDASGRVQALQLGTTAIQASIGGMTANTQITVVAPALKSMTVTPAIPGVAVGSTVQLAALGILTDGSTQDLSGSVTWSSLSTSVATINSSGLVTGVSSGQTMITATQGSVVVNLNLVVAAAGTPPAITASTFPPAGPRGWYNATVTVSFVCTAGSSPILICPAPQVVTGEGISQVISGTATDAAGSHASTSLTISIDATKPSLVVSSPADQAVLTSATVTATGSASDALSGLDSVTCNGIPGSLSGIAFSCQVSLNPGINLLLIRATDAAGNVTASATHITLAAQLPPPTSLQITPTSVSMLDGESQQFTVVDESGRIRTDAVWSVSDSTLATINNDARPILTASDVGSVTATARVGSVSAEVNVTIFGGEAMPVGTSRWSIPALSGFSPALVVKALPTNGGPDLYSLESDQSGNSVVRALTQDGQQLWSKQIAGSGFQAAAGGNGGLLLIRTAGITALDAQSGDRIWEIAQRGLPTNDSGTPAVASDGTIYSWQTNGCACEDGTFQAYLLATDGSTGAPLAQYPIEVGQFIQTLSGQPHVTPLAPTVTDPVIGADGNVWALYAVSDFPNPATALEHFSFIKVSSGVSSTVPFKSIAPGSLAAPFSIVPNGSGGVLVAWQEEPGILITSQRNDVFHVSNVAGEGGAADFTFPDQIAALVLGENGVAYGGHGNGVTAFDTATGNVFFDYSRPIIVELKAALAGVGAIVNELGSGLTSVGSSGNQSAFTGAYIQSPVALSPALWVGGIGSQISAVQTFEANLASSGYYAFGGPQNQHREKKIEKMYLRSFAPFDWFANEFPVRLCRKRCFKGDNRSFSTSTDQSVTARMTAVVDFELPSMNVVSQFAFSDPSFDIFGRAAKTEPKLSILGGGGKMHIDLAASNPLFPLSPDINTKADISVQMNEQAGCYSGHMYGDQFPDSELFVINSQKQAQMLHTYATDGGPESGPFRLIGNNSKDMGSFSNKCVPQ